MWSIMLDSLHGVKQPTPKATPVEKPKSAAALEARLNNLAISLAKRNEAYEARLRDVLHFVKTEKVVTARAVALRFLVSQEQGHKYLRKLADRGYVVQKKVNSQRFVWEVTKC